jgi:hypothetical protein
MSLEQVVLFNSSDQEVGRVEIPPRINGQPPRALIFKGIRFEEGGGPDSFYGPGQFAEVSHG